MVNTQKIIYLDKKCVEFLNKKVKEGFKVSSYVRRLIQKEMESEQNATSRAGDTMINKKNFVDLLLSWYERQKQKKRGKTFGGGELIESKIRDVENESK
jgi:hypothetical protein